MAVQHPFSGSECPALADLLEHLEGDSAGSDPAVSTHLEQCARCNELLASTLRNGTSVTALRRGDPLGVFEMEPELHHLVGRFDHRTDFALTRTLGNETGELSQDLPEPPELADYKILELLDRGGMGVVYRAHQVSLNRDVALKMVLPTSGKPGLLQRFQVESHAVARLQHPNIVQIFDRGETQGRPYFSMELLEGGDLEQRLRHSAVPAREAADLVATLADAVHYSHTEGVLHRDLKPSNVIYTRSGVPKISDFGLARWLLQDGDGELTEDDAVLGTPNYMAPEQARGASDELGPPTDVYGLGALLYRILTGHAPHKGENKLETLERVRRDPPVAPSKHVPGLCRDLEAICLKCLKKAPHQRYESAELLAADLRRWLAGEMPRARKERVRRRLLRYATAAVLAGLLVGLSVYMAAILRAPRDPGIQRALLARRLQHGGPVALVGATGLPNWYRLAGDRSVLEPVRVGPDGTATIRSPSVAFVVLADDPQHGSYRLRAEVRHDLAGRADCGAGLFVGLRQEWFGQEPAQMACLLRYNDLQDRRDTIDLVRAHRPNLNVPPVKGNLLKFMPYLALARPDLTEPLESKLGGPDLTFEPAYEGQRWRKLEIEVHPGLLVARWEGRAEQLLLPMPEVRQKTQERLAVWYRRFDIASPKPVPTPDVRGGLGVYVRNGAISFRNVIIEPSVPPTSSKK